MTTKFRMLPKNVDVVDVLQDDQIRINAFSRYNVRYENMKSDLVMLKKTMEELESANIAIMDTDGQAYLRLGTGLLPVDTLEMDDILERRKEQIQREIDAVGQGIEKLAEEMDGIRAILERKFGDAINLQYEK